jgi:hypothetical protein
MSSYVTIIDVPQRDVKKPRSKPSVKNPPPIFIKQHPGCFHDRWPATTIVVHDLK